MESAKQKVITLLNQLPDDCTFEDIQYHLYVMQKIERGLDNKKASKTFSLDETEYLLKNEANKKQLLKAIKNVEKGENTIPVDTADL